MVQPNVKIYHPSYISVKIYSSIKNKIKELAKKTKTDISFNFEEQYFDIKGRSQQACDDCSMIIMQNLLPQLNATIDEFKFKGTFQDLEDILSSNVSSPASTSSASPIRESTQIYAQGRPLNLDVIDKKYKKKAESSNKENAFFDYQETESDESDESEEEYVETFTFAKNVPNPKEVLTGPSTNNSKPIDYLRVIGLDTETECSLINRQIKIVGNSEESVKEALERFRNLQTIYKRRKRSTLVIPCVHYPIEFSELGLYFCNMERYAQQSYIDLLTSSTAPLHVILPVFKGKDNQYQKPRELISAPSQTISPQKWKQHQQPIAQKELSLDERMKLASLEFGRGGRNSPNVNIAPDQKPLWGENKSYVIRPSVQAAPPNPQSFVSTSTSSYASPSPSKSDLVEDFPALPVHAPAPKKAPTRRVMRLKSQKSASVAKMPSKSNMEIMKEYNLHNIKTALEEGLTTVRGFKGDIKISAKLGKVLWSNVTPEIQKRIWNFPDLKDNLMQERGIQPNFNDVTTKSDDLISKIAEILPQYYSRTAYFEIHAKARNQPIVPYQPVVMYMNQGVVELKKVVTATNKIVEVDWVSLERKFDFQLLLKTEQTTRSDVKPFTTFIKKVAVSPVTRQITYENIPDFLEVDYILLKQTTKYRIHFPFVIEITRVEKLPLVQQKFNNYGIEKILGDTGKGQVWYDLEVFYSTYDEIFKVNNDLPIGKFASWTVKDIIGDENDPSSALVEYIRCLLILIEKCESVI
ncbi:uncharacterized protein BX663DRAFT_459977 [Cokeromyces recurvatus]|uniref:uncharacterized protein n=1 Tax=Cokeromyces recurvatus TaxID=90255 RepID=UPI00222017BB|nr:uncharacterized protein BX663DRAFT_459977 [Cokeromyces recurvatus]KAI7899635.1 hypothetical protein BX663DRAFT_459977 [Cokeromyces recurvatus]